MQKFIMLITLGCTIFAMVLITVIFHVTSTQQIRRDSISSNMEFLERLENELNSQIHKLTTKIQTIYTETSLTSNMKNRQESGANLKTFYWTAGKFVESHFTKTDELESLYIYDLGGMPVNGGAKVKFYNIILGALTYRILSSGLVMIGLTPKTQQLLLGIIFLIEVAVFSDRKTGMIVK